MMHWRAEPLADPTPTRSRRAAPGARPARAEATGRPLVIRTLGLAIAALLTANGVVVAEQATGRDLITLSGDGLSNAREAIARLLTDDKSKSPQVAGAQIEQSTTTTTAAPDTTTTAAPVPVVTAPPATPPSSAPPASTSTTAKKAPAPAGTDWNHVADTVRPYIEKETSLPFTGPVKVTVLDAGPFNDRLNAARMNPAVARAVRAEPILKALGIVDSDVNLADQVRRLSTGSVTTFYDVKANDLVIKNGPLTPFTLSKIVDRKSVV